MNENKEKSFKLKPVSKIEFEKLRPRITVYNEIIDEFLSSNEDIVEVFIDKKVKAASVYSSLKAHSQRHNYAFLVRRRENRIFLLKKEVSK